jgi:hypothetical protein
MHVEGGPVQALKDCDALNDWITDHLQASSEANEDQVMDIWRSLTDDDEVSLSEENQEAILALADRLELRVVLGGN